MTIEHLGIKEKFCPDCFDYRPGEVQRDTQSDEISWQCLECEYVNDISDVPHDPGELELLREKGILPK